VNETARLIDASNSLRDTLDDVELLLAGQEVRRQSQASGQDELPAKLVSRTELEAALAECWQTESAQGGALSLGLVDLDACRELNEAQGMQNVDRVLSTVARVVCASLQGRQLTARLNGEKFLVLFPGRNGRESTGTLELIRQQVETTHFQAGANQFETSVSCAVVEMVSGDNFDSVLERLQVTLNEAKSCGRNRTFFHDGKFPTPVVPPILSLQSRTQEI
jgi:diguanylate cyclase